MADKKSRDLLAMDSRLIARADSYEIKASQVKERPQAPAPIIKAQAAASPPPAKPPKN